MRSKLQKGATAMIVIHALQYGFFAAVIGTWWAWIPAIYFTAGSVWVWFGGWGGHGPAVKWLSRAEGRSNG